MSINTENQQLIKKISDRDCDIYIDLPKYYKLFQYPVSLELSKYVGKKAYQKISVDPLKFLCILVNKVYTTIIEHGNADILSKFILNEKEGFKEKSYELILSVKKWESGAISDETFAEAIEKFCLNTYGVRLPVISFFLRLLLPYKFGTLDVRATNALKIIGFGGIKDIPADEIDKEAYFEKYSGFDYLNYNTLLNEIGKHYKISSEHGEERSMMPCEVDMALYMFDKLESRGSGVIIDQTKKHKIEKILEIIKEIREGAISLANEDWAKEKAADGKRWSGKIRGSAEELMRNMKSLANIGDLDGMFNYYSNALGSESGRLIGGVLENEGKKSLESEYKRVEEIYYSEKM